MAELRTGEASQSAPKARLPSPQGRPAVHELAGAIAGVDLALDTPEGKKAFIATWPDIVDAFLFRRGPQPAKRNAVSKAKSAAEDQSGRSKDDTDRATDW